MGEPEKISVIIPCHYLHFAFIPKLLVEYEKQTVLPAEIIVVLSGADCVMETMIDAVEMRKYKYNLRIIRIEGRSPAGNNRFIGTEASAGEIVIFQDADDLPHCQRIEIIAKMFARYPDVNHLCHAYSGDLASGGKYNTKNTRNIPHQIFRHNMFRDHSEMARYKITNGNIAIRRKIYDKVQWERTLLRAQDVKFNRNIFAVEGKFVLVKLPLYIYRQQNSLRGKIR